MLALISLWMVVAWRIFYLRDFSRNCPDIPAVGFFTERELRTARMIMRRRCKDPPYHGSLTLGQIMINIARFGGYAARKSEPPPGAECIWRGFQKLCSFVEALTAFEAAAP